MPSTLDFKIVTICFGVWMMIAGFGGTSAADGAMFIGGAILIAGATIARSIDGRGQHDKEPEQGKSADETKRSG